MCFDIPEEAETMEERDKSASIQIPVKVFGCYELDDIRQVCQCQPKFFLKYKIEF
jgi:hypothetical protein